MGRLGSELKRRNVVKVGIACCALDPRRARR
jgi:hypothetical protein